MMKFIKQAVTSILAFSLVFSSFAAEKVTVASELWEGYSDEAFNGYYFDLVREALADSDYELEFKILPYARTMSMLEQGAVQMALGMYQGDANGVLYTKHVIELDEIDAAVTKELAASWQGFDSFKGKTIQSRIGNDFAEEFEFDVNYSEKASLANMLKTLSAGRIDAVLDWEPDIMAAVKDDLGGKQDFDIIMGVISSQVWFGFSNDDMGKKLKENFDAGMQKLIDSGRLREIIIKNLGDDSNYPNN